MSGSKYTEEYFTSTLILKLKQNNLIISRYWTYNLLINVFTAKQISRQFRRKFGLCTEQNKTEHRTFREHKSAAHSTTEQLTFYESEIIKKKTLTKTRK